MVLDMGQPVKILDVAKRFAMQQDPPLEIVFTGLRDGEKLHEDLIGADEADERPVHPLITQTPVPPFAFSEIQEIVSNADDMSIERLRTLAYQPTSHDGRALKVER